MPCPENRIHRDSRLISEILQNDNTHRLEWAYSRSRILPMTLNLDSDEQKTRTSSSSWHISESLRPRHCGYEKHKPVHKIWPSQVGLVRNRGCECLQTKRVKIGVILFSGYFFRFIFFLFSGSSPTSSRAHQFSEDRKPGRQGLVFVPRCVLQLLNRILRGYKQEGKKLYQTKQTGWNPSGFGNRRTTCRGTFSCVCALSDGTHDGISTTTITKTRCVRRKF